MDSTKSPNSCALGLLLALPERSNDVQPPCLGWTELLLRRLLACRGPRKGLSSWLGWPLFSCSAMPLLPEDLQRGRSKPWSWLLVSRRLCGDVDSVAQPVSAALFLTLPSCVCKPPLATAGIFYLGSFFLGGCIMRVAVCRLSLVWKNGGYLLFVAVCWILIAVASLVVEQGL